MSMWVSTGAHLSKPIESVNIEMPKLQEVKMNILLLFVLANMNPLKWVNIWN